MERRKLSEKIKEYYEKGQIDEKFIMEATSSTFGGRCWKATTRQDMYDHIDFFWETPKGYVIGIDAKGLKKRRQKDKEYDDSIHWVEIVNVQGFHGWLYGKAEYIAFRTKKDILYVKTEKLRKWIDEKVSGKYLVYRNPSECYVPYQRYQRQDVIVKVPTEDLRSICDFIIELDENEDKEEANN